MMIRLTAADGHDFECWVEDSVGERKAGLVILQEIFGLTDQLKGVARHYSALGYDVAIPALFDRSERGAVIAFTDAPRGRDIMLATRLDETMMDIKATVEALQSRGGKVGVIGFCWGGGLALRAAQVSGIDAAVSFYGTRLPQYLIDPLEAPVQGHFGAQDGHVPPEMLDEARAFFPQMEVFVYPGAGHAFANDARPADYVADAAAQAHKRAEAFFDQHLR